MSERTNRLAVKAVEEASLRAGWFFREQAISDQGIDAHIERFELRRGKRGIDEVGTGRLIALQIKGGPSYFKRPSPNGWWFPFPARKANLWLGHALPVLIVLVDLEAGEIYWARVSTATTIRTGKNYKVEVPRDQTLASGQAEWLELASGLEQRAVSRLEYSLLSVPPTVSALLKGRSSAEQADAALIAMHLAEGRSNPLGTVRSLLATSPVWIRRNAGWAWRAIAAYASEHNLHEDAAAAFIRSASATDSERLKSRDLISAALLQHQGKPEVAASLVDDVEGFADPDNVYVSVARTVLSRPPLDATPWVLDPLLALDVPEVAMSVVAQRTLAMHARRSNELDVAVECGRRALRLDETSDESMNQLAESLLARWSMFGAQVSDLHEGTALLRAVIDARAIWSGPVAEPLERLARAFGVSGQFEALLRLTLPPPHGAADVKSLNRAALRMAAYAARSLGRHDAVTAACDLLGQEPGDQLVRAEVGVLDLAEDEVLRLRQESFVAAREGGDYEDVIRHLLALALVGVDVRDQIHDLAATAVVPDRVITLAARLLEAHRDLDRALPSLRELAKSDSAAADYLLMLLRKADRHTEAADLAEALYGITGSEAYLIEKADSLIDAGGGPAAVKAAEVAVAHATTRPIERARLLTFLGAAAAAEEDWATAERFLKQAVDLYEKAPDSAVWRLVISMINQGRIRRAAKVVEELRPSVRSRDEAEIWLRAHSTIRWTERIAIEACALAERFDDDPQLSTALLTHIVFSTHGVASTGDGSKMGDSGPADDSDAEEYDDSELEERRRLAQNAVPGELHRRAFEMMERLIERHGDRTGIKVLRGADTEDLVGKMVETLKVASQQDASLTDLVDLVRSSRAPLGFLAGALGRCYATLILEKAMGVLVAASPDDHEHELEVAAARTFFDKEVAVDASAVVTLAGLSDPSRLTGRFLSMVTPPAAMLGLHRTSFDIRGLAGSPGSIRWDTERDGLAMTTLGGDEYRRLYSRCENVLRYTDRLRVRAVTEREPLAELATAREHSEWVDVLLLALGSELPVWSDDLGLRRFARGLGLVSFGTPAVIDAVRDSLLESSMGVKADEEAINIAFATQLELAGDMVVDLPLGAEGLLRLAEADGWRACAGALALARPAWWAWTPDGVAVLQRIYDEARVKAPGDLAAWQYAAMYGAASALNAEVASPVLALLALLGYNEDEPVDETRVEGLRRGRQIATLLGHPDPAGAVPAVAAAMARAAGWSGAEELARRVLKALEQPQ